MFKTTSANGFHMTFANGYTVAVQWNAGNYCSNREGGNTSKTPRECSSVEVAVWDKDDQWVQLNPDSSNCVVGWQSADDVAAIMAKVAAM